jgi:hypothetical protein
MVGEYACAQAFRRSDAQAPTGGYRLFVRALFERPERAFSEAVDHGLVVEDIRRALWLAETFEVGRCTEHPARALAKPASSEAGIAQVADTQGNVDAVFNQVEEAVVKQHVDVQAGVLVQERSQVRNDPHTGERHAGADPQVARQASACATGGLVSFVGFENGALGFLEKCQACLGRGQAPGRAQ